MEHLGRTELRRLTICAAIVVVALLLSAVTFYYFQATAPFIPLLVGLLAALPMGIIIDDLRRLSMAGGL